LLNFSRNYKNTVNELKKTNDKIGKEQFISFIKNLPKDASSSRASNIPTSNNWLNYYLDEDYDLRDDQNATRYKKTFDDDNVPEPNPFNRNSELSFVSLVGKILLNSFAGQRHITQCQARPDGD
jgi:hypothetical protein